MLKKYMAFLLFTGLALQFPVRLTSQVPEVFTSKDFDLNGMVKSCLVITDYGREEFEFNRGGLLTKSVTRYSSDEYDVTYYIYKEGNLKERRDESFRDGEFDKATSIAHVYTLDTIPQKKITEKILSYNREFLDTYEYLYDGQGNLVKITRSNNDRLDETLIKYTRFKDESTISYLLNGVILKSVRTSFSREKDGSEVKNELTKEFIEGVPVKAVEKISDSSGKVVREVSFNYDPGAAAFVPSRERQFQYDDHGMLSSVATKAGKAEDRKEYIYQFDSHGQGNWVKKIITPDNEYTTRKIVYYDEITEVED